MLKPTRLRLSKSGLFVAAGCLGAFLAGAAAFASTQTSTAVIHGCYATKTGVLRRIPATRHCKRGEKSLNWNGQGTQGVKGDAGSAGADGTTIGTRVRLVGAPMFAVPTTSIASDTPQVSALSLAGASWDQAPDEVDQVVGGQATFEWRAATAAGCHSDTGGFGTMSSDVVISVDGSPVREVGNAGMPDNNSATSSTVTVRFDGQLASLFEPGQTTHHTITAEIHRGIGDYCTNGGQWGISDLELDIARMQ